MKKRISQMKLKNKLTAAFMLLSLVGIILGFAALTSINTLTRMSNDLNTMKKESHQVTTILNAHYSWRQDLISSVLTESPFDGVLDETACLLGQWIRDEESNGLMHSSIMAVFIEINESHTFIHREAQKIVNYIKTGHKEEAQQFLIGTILPKTQEVIRGIMRMEEIYSDMVTDKAAEIVVIGEAYSFIIILLIAAAVIAGLLFSLLIPRSIVKPLNVLSEYIIKASEGDFSIRLPEIHIEGMAQLYQTCNTLVAFCEDSVGRLADLVLSLRKTSNEMASISDKMAENSMILREQTSSVSSVTEEFSAGLTQTVNSLSTASSHISTVASSIEEINSTISNVAAAAEETSTRVVQSSDLAVSIQTSITSASDSLTMVSGTFNVLAKSVEDINQSISAVSESGMIAMKRMSDADDKAKNTNQIIQRLEATSRKIGKIVSVISDIADQTNMLALNAAIEAASAGEAGRGFMVVANEVKELAKQTAEATDEIADHIENMQHNMPEAVDAVSEITTIINSMAEFMQSFTQELRQQGIRTDQITGETVSAVQRMNKINEEINRISDNALSVTKTVIDSTKGVNEIAKATAELVLGSQEIAMNSERASNNLSEISRTGKEMTSGLLDISQNIHLINKEAGEFQISADSTKELSDELLTLAGGLEELRSKFIIS